MLGRNTKALLRADEFRVHGRLPDERIREAGAGDSDGQLVGEQLWHCFLFLERQFPGELQDGFAKLLSLAIESSWGGCACFVNESLGAGPHDRGRAGPGNLLVGEQDDSKPGERVYVRDLDESCHCLVDVELAGCGNACIGACWRAISPAKGEWILSQRGVL
jgi:hypothetical protein